MRKERKPREPRSLYDRYSLVVFYENDQDLLHHVSKLDTLYIKVGIEYMVIGFEVSPETHRKHLQCYVECKNAVRPHVLRRILYDYHIEPAQKSRKENFLYCTKSGKYKVYDPTPILLREGGDLGGGVLQK